MGLFSAGYHKSRFVRPDPEIDVDAHKTPEDGDLLVYSTEYGGKFVAGSPPIVADIGDLISDGDLIVWDATDEQLEPASPAEVIDAGAAYGALTVLDGAVTQAVTSTPGKLTAFDTDGASQFLTPANATDDITVDTDGDGTYEATVSISFSYAAAAVVQFRLRVDTVESAIGGQFEVLNSGDIVNVSFSGIVALAEAEVVTVYVEASADANITVIDAQLMLKRLSL